MVSEERTPGTAQVSSDHLLLRVVSGLAIKKLYRFISIDFIWRRSLFNLNQSFLNAIFFVIKLNLSLLLNLLPIMGHSWAIVMVSVNSHAGQCKATIQ